MASDGHNVDVYIAKPGVEPRGAVVVVQEIFGVNKHMRDVTDGFAIDGYFAVAPALFDRVERGVELGYEPEDIARARRFREQLDINKSLLDVEAAILYAREQSKKKVAVVGFCFGGLIAWLSATRLNVDAAVGYYPGGIGKFAAETPRVPTQLHFGRLDAHIPAGEVNKVHAAHHDVDINWYAGAEHAFSNDMRPSFNPQATALARARTLAFLKASLA